MPPSDPRAPRGRGARSDPVNRFTRLEVLLDPEEVTDDDLRTPTRYLLDSSRSVISTNSSPDVGFDASLNPYRGCEHGCAYCYARPSHEFLGLSAGLDFERTILVKRDASTLLERRLATRGWKAQVLALSGVTDPYQPVERKLGITRACLAVLARFRNPVSLITKNALVTRDADILADMASWNGARVTLSITTLDEALRRALEPRTSTLERRLEAVSLLARAGVPTGVNIAPIIPGLTDQDVPRLLGLVAEAGATHAGYTVLRLPGSVGPLFEAWLDAHAPLHKAKVLRRVSEAHGGQPDDRLFGRRMRGNGAYADQVHALFRLARRRAGIPGQVAALATDRFRVPGTTSQPGLFGQPPS